MLTNVERDLQNLQRTAPEEQGISASAILDFVQALESQVHELHSFMLLRHGCVVAEGWWSPYGRQHPHMLFSLSKSFTATAVGLAIAEGRFTLEDLVLTFFPDETPAEVSDFLAALRVRHLLSMTTGHAEDTWAYLTERADANWIQGFLEVPLRHAPGSHFAYNTGATYLLAAIVQKTTGMKLVDYLQPRLFAPLGIKNAAWQESPQGIALGGIGLSLKTEEIARFGQLYLQKGQWQGRQLLSEEWVTVATAAQVANGEDAQSDWTQGYGYQFWRCRHRAYRGDGVFGQYCIVMPEQDAVLAITGGVDLMEMQQPLNLLWERLLPAMGSEPLAADAGSQQRLAEKLSNLTLPLVQGQATSPLASQISGQSYVVDGNELEIESITLNFADTDWKVMVKTATGEESIPCGYGAWQQGQSSLFNRPWLFEPTPTVACGAWTAADSFTMVVRLYETPFFHTLVFHFAGDEMMVETRVNVSFESSEMLLTARRA
jgi:CubicO group peptidase (beta-lactamase class C family)